MGKSSSGRHRSGSETSSRPLRRASDENCSSKSRHGTDSMSTSSRRKSSRRDTYNDNDVSGQTPRSATADFAPTLTAEPSEISGTYYTARNGDEKSHSSRSETVRKSDRNSRHSAQGDNTSTSRKDSEKSRRHSRKSSQTDRMNSARAYKGNDASLPRNQFPGESPAAYSQPYRPSGLASDYYGDNGESVAFQPGVRPNQPSIVTSAEHAHLMEPSIEAKPPPEPSSLGQTGAAASYFGAGVLDSASGMPPTPSKPPRNPSLRPNKQPKHSQTGTSPRTSPDPHGPHFVTGAVSMGAAADYYSGASGGVNAGHGYQTPSRPSAQAASASFSAPADFGGLQQHSNTALYGGAALAGAAAGTYISSHAHDGGWSSQHHASAMDDPQVSVHGRPTSHFAPTQHVHRHKRRGPLGKFVDWFRDPDAVAEYEQYTEAIGVCKYCFDPMSSPADAPRRHHFQAKRRSSGSRYGSTTRVDKTYRYSSDEDKRRRSAARKTVIGGLTGYGAAKIGEALYKSKYDFDDTYSVKSGQPANQSRVTFQDGGPSYERRSRRYPSSEDVRLQGRDTSRRTTNGNGRTGKGNIRRRDSSSSSSPRGIARGAAISTAAGAAGLAMGASAVNDISRSRRSGSPRPQKKYYSRRVSPMHSYVDLSATNEESGGLVGFFTSPSANKKKGREAKGFFNFGNASSSSSDADLAFGAATVRRKASKKRMKETHGKQGRHDSSGGIMGLLATGEALAAESVRRGKRGKKLDDADEMTGRYSSRTNRQHYSTNDHHDSAEGHDEEWYDTDDNDSQSSSSVDTALAYGGGISALQSRESLVQDRRTSTPMYERRSHDRFGTKDERRSSYGDSSRRSDALGSSTFQTGAAAAAAAVGAVGALAASNATPFGRPPSSLHGDLPPMREVEPRPISDYDFNVSRNGSHRNEAGETHGVAQPRKISATSVPLQQPQPIVPVAPFFQGTALGMTRQEEGRPSFDAPLSEGDQRSSRQTAMDYSGDVRRTRRDSSPAKLSSQNQKNNVSFSLTEDQLDNEKSAAETGFKRKSRRSDKDRRRSSESVSTKSKLVDGPENLRNGAEVDNGRSAEARRTSLDSSDERVAEIERELKRLYAEQRQSEERDRKQKDELSGQIIATAAAAATAAVVAKSKRSSTPEEDSTPRLRSSLKKMKERKVSPPAESQQERIARMAAQRVGSSSSPVYEDYGTFFVPKELQEHLKEHNAQAEHRDDIGANVVEIIPGAARSRPQHPFDPFTYRPFGLELEDDPTLHPWAVPMLELVEPTPPGSQAHSVQGDTSPMIAPKPTDASVDEAKDMGEPLERKASAGSKVTWGDHDTYVYEVQTPEYERANYMPEAELGEATHSKTQSSDDYKDDATQHARPVVHRVWTLDEVDAEKLEKEVPVVDDRPQMSRAWTVDDTEADQLEHEIPSAVPTGTRRKSPSTVLEEPPPMPHDLATVDSREQSRAVYQSPFAETVSDLAVHPEMDDHTRNTSRSALRAKGEDMKDDEGLLDGETFGSSPAVRVSKSQRRRLERASSSSEGAKASGDFSAPEALPSEGEIASTQQIPEDDSVFDYMVDSKGDSVPSASMLGMGAAAILPSEPLARDKGQDDASVPMAAEADVGSVSKSRRSTTFDESVSPMSASTAHCKSDPEEWERPRGAKESKRSSKSDIGSEDRKLVGFDRQASMRDPDIEGPHRSRTGDDISDLQDVSEDKKSKRKSKRKSASFDEAKDDGASKSRMEDEEAKPRRHRERDSGLFDDDELRSSVSSPVGSEKKSDKKSSGFFGSIFSSNKSDVSTSSKKSSKSSKADGQTEQERDDRRGSRRRRSTKGRDLDDAASIASETSRKSRRNSVSRNDDQPLNSRDQSIDDGFVSAEDRAEDEENFLGKRPEMPPPTVMGMPMVIDGVSGPALENRTSDEPIIDVGEHIESETRSGLEATMKSGPLENRSHKIPPPAAEKGNTVPAESVGIVEAEAESVQKATQPVTPRFASSQRLSAVRTSDLPSSPTNNSSPTAVPLHFRRPPASPTDARFSMSSPIASPSSPLTTPRTRQGRPKSTEFRSSKEFRPLYLVEVQNARIATPEATENYPSLPSSRTSSANASTEDLRAGAQAQEPEYIIPSRLSAQMFRERGRRHSYSYWHDEQRRESPDYLDSRSATPVPSEAQRARESGKKPKPTYEFHSPSELLQDPDQYRDIAVLDEGEKPASPLPSVISTDADQDYMSARSRSLSPTRARSLSRGRSKSTSRSTSAAWQDALTTTVAGVIAGSVLGIAADEVLQKPEDFSQSTDDHPMAHNAEPATSENSKPPGGQLQEDKRTAGEDGAAAHLPPRDLSIASSTSPEDIPPTPIETGERAKLVIGNENLAALIDQPSEAQVLETDQSSAMVKTKKPKKAKKTKRSSFSVDEVTPGMPPDDRAAASVEEAPGSEVLPNDESPAIDQPLLFDVKPDATAVDCSNLDSEKSADVDKLQAAATTDAVAWSKAVPTERVGGDGGLASSPASGHVDNGPPTEVFLGRPAETTGEHVVDEEVTPVNELFQTPQTDATLERPELSPFEQAFEAAVNVRGLSEGATVEDAVQAFQPEFSEQQELSGTPLATIEEVSEMSTPAVAIPSNNAQLGRKPSKKEKRHAKKSSKKSSDYDDWPAEGSVQQMEIPQSQQKEVVPMERAGLDMEHPAIKPRSSEEPPTPSGVDFEIQQDSLDSPNMETPMETHIIELARSTGQQEEILKSATAAAPAEQSSGGEWLIESKKGKKAKKDKKSKKKQAFSWDDEPSGELPVDEFQPVQDPINADSQPNVTAAKHDAPTDAAMDKLADKTIVSSLETSTKQEPHVSDSAQDSSDVIWGMSTKKGKKKSKRKSLAWADEEADLVSSKELQMVVPLESPEAARTAPAVDYPMDKGTVFEASKVEEPAALDAEKLQDVSDVPEQVSPPTTLEETSALPEEASSEHAPVDEAVQKCSNEYQDEAGWGFTSKKDKKKRASAIAAAVGTAGTLLAADSLDRDASSSEVVEERADANRTVEGENEKEVQAESSAGTATYEATEHDVVDGATLAPVSTTVHDNIVERISPGHLETVSATEDMLSSVSNAPEASTTAPLAIEAVVSEDNTDAGAEGRIVSPPVSSLSREAEEELLPIKTTKSKKDKKGKKKRLTLDDDFEAEQQDRAREKTTETAEAPSTSNLTATTLPEEQSLAENPMQPETISRTQQQGGQEPDADAESPMLVTKKSKKEKRKKRQSALDWESVEAATLSSAIEDAGGGLTVTSEDVDSKAEYPVQEHQEPYVDIRSSEGVSNGESQKSFADSANAAIQELAAHVSSATEPLAVSTLAEHSAIGQAPPEASECTPSDKPNEKSIPDPSTETAIPELARTEASGGTSLAAESLLPGIAAKGIPTPVAPGSLEPSYEAWDFPSKKSKKDKKSKRQSALRSAPSESSDLPLNDQNAEESPDKWSNQIEQNSKGEIEQSTDIVPPDAEAQAVPDEEWSLTPKKGKKEKKKKRQSTLEMTPLEVETPLLLAEDTTTGDKAIASGEAFGTAEPLRPDERTAAGDDGGIEGVAQSIHADEENDMWAFTTKKSKKDKKGKRKSGLTITPPDVEEETVDSQHDRAVQTEENELSTGEPQEESSQVTGFGAPEESDDTWAITTKKSKDKKKKRKSRLDEVDTVPVKEQHLGGEADKEAGTEQAEEPVQDEPSILPEAWTTTTPAEELPASEAPVLVDEAVPREDSMPAEGLVSHAVADVDTPEDKGARLQTRMEEAFPTANTDKHATDDPASLEYHESVRATFPPLHDTSETVQQNVTVPSSDHDLSDKPAETSVEQQNVGLPQEDQGADVEEWATPVKKSKKDKKKNRETSFDDVPTEPLQAAELSHELPKSLDQPLDTDKLNQPLQTVEPGQNGDQSEAAPEEEWGLSKKSKKEKKKKKRQSTFDDAFAGEATIAETEPASNQHAPIAPNEDYANSAIPPAMRTETSDLIPEPTIDDEWSLSKPSKKGKKKKRQSAFDDSLPEGEASPLEPAPEPGQNLPAGQPESLDTLDVAPTVVAKLFSQRLSEPGNEDDWGMSKASKKDKSKKGRQEDVEETSGIRREQVESPTAANVPKEREISEHVWPTQPTPADDAFSAGKEGETTASSRLAVADIENTPNAVASTEHERSVGDVDPTSVRLLNDNPFPTLDHDKTGDRQEQKVLASDDAAGSHSLGTPEETIPTPNPSVEVADIQQPTQAFEVAEPREQQADIKASEAPIPAGQPGAADELFEQEWSFSTKKSRKDKKKKRPLTLDVDELRERPQEESIEPDTVTEHRELGATAAEPTPGPAASDSAKIPTPVAGVEDEWSRPARKSKKDRKKQRQSTMQHAWEEQEPQETVTSTVMGRGMSTDHFEAAQGGDGQEALVTQLGSDNESVPRSAQDNTHEVPEQKLVSTNLDTQPETRAVGDFGSRQESSFDSENGAPEEKAAEAPREDAAAAESERNNWSGESNREDKDNRLIVQDESIPEKPEATNLFSKTMRSGGAMDTVLPTGPESSLTPAGSTGPDIAPEDDWGFSTKKSKKKSKKNRASLADTGPEMPEAEATKPVQQMDNDTLVARAASPEPMERVETENQTPQAPAETAAEEYFVPVSRKKSKKDKKKKSLPSWTEPQAQRDDGFTENVAPAHGQEEGARELQDVQEPQWDTTSHQIQDFAASADSQVMSLNLGIQLGQAASGVNVSSAVEASDPARAPTGMVGSSDQPREDAAKLAANPLTADSMRVYDAFNTPMEPHDILGPGEFASNRAAKKERRQFEYNGAEARLSEKERRQFEFNGNAEPQLRPSTPGTSRSPEDTMDRPIPQDLMDNHHRQAHSPRISRPQEDEELMSDVSASTRERRKRRRSPPAWSGEEPDDLPTSRALTPPPDHDDIMDTALVVAAGLGIGDIEREPTQENPTKSTSPARQPSAGWSFAQLGADHDNRDSGIQLESPMLAQGQISSTRDSGFVQSPSDGTREIDTAMDVSLRPPRPQSPTSSTEDVSQTATRRIHKGEKGVLETPRRKPSPVESTSKDRSSILFSSPAMPTPLDTKARERSPAPVSSPLRRSPSIHGHHLSREELRQKAKSAHALEPSDELASNLIDRAAAAEVTLAPFEAPRDHPFSPRSSLNTIREENVEANSQSGKPHPFSGSPVSLIPHEYPEKPEFDGTPVMAAAGAAGLAAAALSRPPRDLGPARSLGTSKSRTSSLRNLRGNSDQQDRSVYSPSPNLVHEQELDKSATRDRDMADIYDGYCSYPGSPKSPTRPPSVRRRQSMQQIKDLETRLDQLASENRALAEAKMMAEQSLEHANFERNRAENSIDSLKNTAVQVQERDADIARLKQEIASLTATHETLKREHEHNLAQLQQEHEHAQSQWQESSRELETLRSRHAELSSGMESIVRHEIDTGLAEKDAEVLRLRADLEEARQKIRHLQSEILKRGADDVVAFRDEDYFDAACQKLCQQVQGWVLRFSKYNDLKMCRATNEVRDEKIVDRFDNAILDGSDVDTYLADRVTRRDVFMSVVMTMIWEYVFTRYLFGMDREQRQKLKQLEKNLGEVGPASAVHQWRALTLTLLSKRESFKAQRESDTEAVAIEIFNTLSRFLPPPQNLEQQIVGSLRNVMHTAVELSIEMRTQRAEYIMLPPLQPEYDTNGDLARKVYFNASLMNERSGETTSNEELERNQAVVRMVLFPLVVKKGDDNGVGDDEIVVCPAQVLIARPDKGKKPRGAARAPSGGSHSDRMNVDARSLRAVSTHSLGAMSGIDANDNMF